MILYRLLGNIRKSGYFGIAHSLFTAHFKNVPLREGQFLLSYRQLVDKVIVIYFFYGSVIQKMFVFTKAYVIFNSPEDFGSQSEASKIPFFTFSFFLADIFTL